MSTTRPIDSKLTEAVRSVAPAVKAHLSPGLRAQLEKEIRQVEAELKALKERLEGSTNIKARLKSAGSLVMDVRFNPYGRANENADVMRDAVIEMRRVLASNYPTCADCKHMEARFDEDWDVRTGEKRGALSARCTAKPYCVKDHPSPSLDLKRWPSDEDFPRNESASPVFPTKSEVLIQPKLPADQPASDAAGSW